LDLRRRESSAPNVAVATPFGLASEAALHGKKMPGVSPAFFFIAFQQALKSLVSDLERHR
jgi:hypothetical protein